MSILARARPDLAQFRAYVSARSAGFDAPIRLNANESPSDAAGGSNGCNRYPDPQPAALRDALAGLYDIDPSRLCIGRGSDEAIDLLIRGFCRAGIDNIVTPTPTFGMYRVGAKLQGAECRELALDAADDFRLDAERLLGLVDDRTRLVFVCSPNNPTGSLHHDTLPFLARRLRGRALLVVDEAYIEFAEVESATALVDEYDNVAVLRTLSKAHALAGARIGALIAREDVVAFIRRIAAPYPLPSPCVALACSALEPMSLQAARARVASTGVERARVARALAKLPQVDRVWPSAANFVLARFADGNIAFERALAAGVVVRNFGTQAGLADCLRVTIGAPHENDAWLDALGSVDARPRFGSALAARRAMSSLAGDVS